MTEQEFKDKISYTTITQDDRTIRMIGELRLHAEMVFGQPELINSPVVLSYAKEKVAENMLRMLYQDQREQLYKKIDEFCMCAPFDISRQAQFRDELLELAKHQCPFQEKAGDNNG